MSRGKHLSLEEARKLKQFEQFAKEHPSKGDRKRFEKALGAMVKGAGEGAGTSGADSPAGSSDTRTPRDTSEDASRKR